MFYIIRKIEKSQLWRATKCIPISSKANGTAKMFSCTCCTAIHLYFESRSISAELDVETDFSSLERCSDCVFYHCCGVRIPCEILRKERQESLHKLWCLLKKHAPLRVVSNFGDSGKIHVRVKMGSRKETRHEGRKWAPAKRRATRGVDHGQTREICKKTRKILQRKGCHFYCSKFDTFPVSC